MKDCLSCTRMSRRDMLKHAASLTAFLTLTKRGDAQVQSSGVRVRGTARACIFVYLNGAPSHIDTFDVKSGSWNPPDADIREYHGGIALSATLFPKLSQL